MIGRIGLGGVVRLGLDTFRWFLGLGGVGS